MQRIASQTCDGRQNTSNRLYIRSVTLVVRSPLRSVSRPFAVIDRRQTARLPYCHPGSPGWWLRVAVSFLAVGYLNFIPLHLATELHDHRVEWGTESGTELAAYEHAHGHADGHAPHLAADHLLRVSAASLGSVSFFSACVPDTASLVPVLPPTIPRLLHERDRPPGLAPPEPLQPRAPPVA